MQRHNPPPGMCDLRLPPLFPFWINYLLGQPPFILVLNTAVLALALLSYLPVNGCVSANYIIK